MEKNKNMALIIELLVIFIIFFCIIIVLFINRDSIYNFLSKKANEDTYEVLNTNPNNVPANTQDEDGIDKINETAPTTPLPNSPSPEVPVTELTSELPVLPSETIPAATEIKYIEAPKSEFMQVMFDAAIEIPDSGNKIIEPPPLGRSEELQYGVVSLNETIPEPYEYFKNALFLGDSVTTGFDLFRKKIDFNGELVIQDVTVVAVGSYGVYNATREITNKTIHPLFDGKQIMPEDIIATKDAKNVFICLGLNDIVWQETDEFLDYYLTLVNRIKEKSPDKNVVIMSITPVVAHQTVSSMTTEIITTANNALLEFAKKNGIPFIDYGAAIRDGENNLYDDFSSDGYCHLTVSAYKRLVEYMLYHPIKY